MKNTEYRKGNLIYGSIYFDENEAREDLGDEYSEEIEWRVCIIEGICHDNEDYNFWLKAISKSRFDGEEEFKRTKDIPIARDWLLKMGFIEEEEKSYINGFRYLKQVKGHHDDIKKEGIDRDGTWMDGIGTLLWKKTGELVVNTLCRGNYCANSVKYVHELQNLFFALSGEELK